MNSFRLSALSGACVLLAAILTGCGEPVRTTDYQDGVAAYEKRDFKKAERLFENAVRQCSTNVDALVYLTRTHLALGEIPAARDVLVSAMEIAGGDADVRLLDAQTLSLAKETTRACKAFRDIAEDIRLSPKLRAQGWAGLGVVEMSADNIDSARVAFLRAIRLDHGNAAARYHLGLLYRDNFGYPEAALEELMAYSRLDDKDAPRVQKVVRTYIPALQKTIAQAAATRPGSQTRNAAVAAQLVQKAETAEKRNSLKTAKNLYAEALRTDPLSYAAALGLAKVSQRTDASRNGQQQALGFYRTACSLKPSSISTYLMAGDLAMRLNQPATAVEIYSRALAANPASIDALDGLIRALRRVGNRSKSAQAYQSYRDSLAPARKR